MSIIKKLKDRLAELNKEEVEIEALDAEYRNLQSDLGRHEQKLAAAKVEDRKDELLNKIASLDADIEARYSEFVSKVEPAAEKWNQIRMLLEEAERIRDQFCKAEDFRKSLGGEAPDWCKCKAPDSLTEIVTDSWPCSGSHVLKKTMDSHIGDPRTSAFRTTQ